VSGWAMATGRHDFLTKAPSPLLRCGILHFPGTLRGPFRFFPVKRSLLLGIAAAAAATSPIFFQAPSQAACLTNTGGIAPAIDNNCVTYDTTSSPTTATLYYSDSNLGNSRWQLTGTTSTIGNFSGWEYFDGTSFTSFDPGFVASGGLQIGSIFTTLTTPAAPAGNPFRIRVKLSDTATLNAGYQFILRTNSDGFTNGSGALDDTGNNNFSALTRQFTRVDDPVPTETPSPLPLMGAAAAFGYSRKIRKAIRAAG